MKRVVYQESVRAKNVEFWGTLLGSVPIQWMQHLEKSNDGQQQMQRRMQQQWQLKMQQSWRMKQSWRMQQMRQYRHLRMSPYLFLCICTLLYRWLIILFVSSRINGGRGQKRPREEETQETEVQPSSDALEFEAMAYDGFEAIREEEEGVIVPVVPLMIIEPHR